MGPRRGELGNWGRRLWLQLAGLVAFNGFYWREWGKYFCLPVLNCYACPVGTVACPIGSLTAFALIRDIPYYIIGTIGIVGVSVGRAFCGWACPFGLLQDGLYRIPSPKWRLPRAADGLKYGLLAVLVIGLPWMLGAGLQSSGAQRILEQDTGSIDYCALVCPAGTLEAGIPGLAVNPDIRSRVSWRTWSKLGILVVVLGLMVVSRRSFCRGLCPLGALIALASRISLLQLRTDPEKCTRCMRCTRVCPTACRTVPEEPGGKETTAECVLCLDCVRSCPETGALSARLAGRVIAMSQGKKDVKDVKDAKDAKDVKDVKDVNDG